MKLQIDSLIDTSKNDQVKVFKAVSELKYLVKKIKNSNCLKEKMNELIEETTMEEKQPEQDFFSDNNDVQKKTKHSR